MFRIIAVKSRKLSQGRWSSTRGSVKLSPSKTLLHVRKKVDEVKEASRKHLINPDLAGALVDNGFTVGLKNLVMFESQYHVAMDAQDTLAALKALLKMQCVLSRAIGNYFRINKTDRSVSYDDPKIHLLDSVQQLYSELSRSASYLFLDLNTESRMSAGKVLFDLVRDHVLDSFKENGGQLTEPDRHLAFRVARDTVSLVLDCVGIIGLVNSLVGDDDEIAWLARGISAKDLSINRVYSSLPASDKPNVLTEENKVDVILSKTRLREWTVLNRLKETDLSWVRQDFEFKTDWILRLHEANLPDTLREQLTVTQGSRETVRFAGEISKLSRSASRSTLFDGRPPRVFEGVSRSDLELFFDQVRPYDCGVMDCHDDRLWYLRDQIRDSKLMKGKSQFCTFVANDLRRIPEKTSIHSGSDFEPTQEMSPSDLTLSLVFKLGTEQEVARAEAYLATLDESLSDLGGAAVEEKLARYKLLNNRIVIEELLDHTLGDMSEQSVLQQALLASSQFFINLLHDLVFMDLIKLKDAFPVFDEGFPKEIEFGVVIYPRREGAQSKVTLTCGFTDLSRATDESARIDPQPLMTIELSIDMRANESIDLRSVDCCLPFNGFISPSQVVNNSGVMKVLSTYRKLTVDMKPAEE